MKKFITAFGRFLVVLSIIFLFIKFSQHLNEIPDFTWGFEAALSLFATVTFVAGAFALSVYTWVILLHGGGVFLTLRQAYVIMGKSQIAKYLPGNILHYFGQIALGHKAGISTEAIVLSIGAQTLIGVVTPATIAIIGLLFDKGALAWLVQDFAERGFSMTMFISVILIIIILTVTAFLLPHTRAWIRPRLAYLHIGRVSASVLLYLTVFVLFGMFISLLLRTLWDVNVDVQWYQFTWGFALAWVLGFITPGAPGGIGIREAVFVGLYGQGLGEGLVIGLAVVLRVVTSLGDLLAFGLAYWLGKQKAKG